MAHFNCTRRICKSYWPPRLLWEMTWNDHVRVINIFLHPQIGTLISRKCRYGWFLVTLGEWCLLPDIFADWSWGTLVTLPWLLYDFFHAWIQLFNIHVQIRFEVLNLFGPSGKLFWLRLLFVLKHPLFVLGLPLSINHPALELVRQWSLQPFHPLPPGSERNMASFWNSEHGQEDGRVFQVPSRELTYPTKREKENHLQICLMMGIC